MNRSGPSRRRRGSILVVAIVCLGFAATVLFGALRIGLLQRRQLQVDHDACQAQWLLDAGVRLAIDQTSSDSSYRGQQLLVEQGLRPPQTGAIKITVERDKLTALSSVTVVAKISDAFENQKSALKVKRSHSFTIPTN